tara:strand:- start:93 stop:371 length:279 start_codon:yes stop_codon:yes gene_type:complete
MTKFFTVLYICSVLSGQCPSYHYTGHSFATHSECVEFGYRIAYGTFRNLEETEEFDNGYIENSKIVVKFECKEMPVPKENLENMPKKPSKNT